MNALLMMFFALKSEVVTPALVDTFSLKNYTDNIWADINAPFVSPSRSYFGKSLDVDVIHLILFYEQLTNW